MQEWGCSLGLPLSFQGHQSSGGCSKAGMLFAFTGRGLSARQIVMDSPKVSYRYVESSVISAAGWGALLPLAQLAPPSDLVAPPVEKKTAWVFSGIRHAHILSV